MKNVICIDYSITSKDDLKLICNKYSFKYDELLSNKNKFDFYKIFIDLNTYRMFAYILNKNKSKIEFTDGVDIFLNAIEPEKITQETKLEVNSSLSVELDIDVILDKIHKYGIGSLLREEKEFLDNSSKI
jgi:hypothetical protein